jgi:hypothetical protein
MAEQRKRLAAQNRCREIPLSLGTRFGVVCSVPNSNLDLCYNFRMKAAESSLVVSIALLLLVSNGSIMAQKDKSHTNTQEQTFGTEGSFERPIAISASALSSLKADKQSAGILRDCAEQERIRVADIPSSWFVGSTIALTNDGSSGLVVRGEHPCLLGAHITQFWVLAESAGGYRSLFTARADGLTFLSHRTNGYRDLQLVFVMKAGAEIQYVTFHYVNGSYRFSRRRIENADQG